MVESKHKFSTDDILKVTGGRLRKGSLSSSFTDISTDSRTIKPGELFIALNGEHFDGSRFVSGAYEKGAHGAIVRKGAGEKEWDGKGAIIEVEDSLNALGDIARFWRMKHPIPLIGITGSNGKTTTKEMIGIILEKSFSILQTEGNFNNLVGLPLTLLRLKQGHEIAILEMGTNARSEIKRLSEISTPDIAVITNIGQAHLEGLHTIEEVMAEKGELFSALREDSFAIINKDDPRVLHLASQCRCRKISFSTTKKADLMAKEISVSDSGRVRFQLSNGSKDIAVNLPLYGIFNVHNALAAAGVAIALGVGLETIKEGMEGIKPPPGRMEVIELDRYTIINDTYNANPSSMEQALKTLAGIKGRGRAVAVLGDMFELGEFTESAHIEIGRLVSGLGIDFLLTLGRQSENICRGAYEGGMGAENIYTGEKHQAVASKLRAIIGKGDYILVKGSRAMKMELIIEELMAETG